MENESKTNDITRFDIDTFAYRLKELMKSHQITQQQLADKLGSKRQTISQYVNGTVQPNIEKLYEMAQIFEVSADYLLGLSETTTSNVTIRDIHNMLGLSEKAIEELYDETSCLCKLANNPNPDEAYEAKRHGLFLPMFKVLNVLICEKQDPFTVLELMADVFNHEPMLEKEEWYEIQVLNANDNDEVESSGIKDPPEINDEDLFYIRLLKLQQGVIKLKEKLDKQGIKL